MKLSIDHVRNNTDRVELLEQELIAKPNYFHLISKMEFLRFEPNLPLSNFETNCMSFGTASLEVRLR
jgi:hypothetical protein